ncbi:MAG: DUF3089 domain-containing protein [Microthrixaceae bacterium]
MTRYTTPPRGRRASLVATLLALVVALTGAACSGGDGEAGGDRTGSSTTARTTDASSTTVAPYRSAVYADPVNWLCRPDRSDDACDIDLDATLVRADGTTEVQPYRPASDPAADCFYVYPTISGDPPPNADLVAGPEERTVVANQFARFGSVCRLFAPVYRQVPLAGLSALGATTTTAPPAGTPSAPTPGQVAYADVLDAWRQYLANDNDGRPVVLIGHSQGSGHLVRLLTEAIVTEPAVRGRLVAAVLAGNNVKVPGSPGAIPDLPVCTERDGRPTTGCLVSYVSFAAGSPPPDGSLFGRPRDGQGRIVCANPADLTDAPAPLDSYFPARPEQGLTTPWVRYQGLLQGRCTSDDRYDWLDITNTHATGDARPADVGGRITPVWGLHLIDVNLALGDLVDLVGRQVRAFG